MGRIQPTTFIEVKCQSIDPKYHPGHPSTPPTKKGQCSSQRQIHMDSYLVP